MIHYYISIYVSVCWMIVGFFNIIAAMIYQHSKVLEKSKRFDRLFKGFGYVLSSVVFLYVTIKGI